MTFEEVVKHTNDAFHKGGYKDFREYGITLKINNRLSTTLGRCMAQRIDNRWKPTSIEIAGKLLSNATDKEILDVIYHEAAHALVDLETGEKHGHDSYFKGMCARIGTANDGAYTHVESYSKEAASKLFKYEVSCPNCGVIANYSRMCKTLQNLASCNCTQCGSRNLTYRQNY